MSKRSWSENADLCRKAVVKASHNRWIWSLTSKKLQSICGYQSNQEESEMERNHSLLRSQLAKIKYETMNIPFLNSINLNSITYHSNANANSL